MFYVDALLFTLQQCLLCILALAIVLLFSWLIYLCSVWWLCDCMLIWFPIVSMRGPLVMIRAGSALQLRTNR